MPRIAPANSCTLRIPTGIQVALAPTSMARPERGEPDLPAVSPDLMLAFLGVGDVFMVPQWLARLTTSEKPDRPWVVVMLGGPPRRPAQATLVPGTSRR